VRAALAVAVLVLSPPAVATADPRVEAIRDAVDRIEVRLPDMRRDERLVAGLSAEGALVTAWRGPGGIEKIHVEALGETGRRLTDIHVADGAPLRVYDLLLAYGAGDAERTVSEARHYLAAGAPATPDGTGTAEAAARARSLLRLMSTPAPASGDACEWRCADERGAECVRYTCD
jgi:hypothetical protein